MGAVIEGHVTCIDTRTPYSGIFQRSKEKIRLACLGRGQGFGDFRFFPVPDNPVFDGFAAVEAAQDRQHSKVVRGTPNLIMYEKSLASWTFHSFLPS